MHAERRILASFVLLLGLQLVTSLGAITLLARMAPAIEQILEENVYSVRAVEDMLAILSHSEPPSDAQRAEFVDALQRAKANVTEPAERPVLQTLSRVAGPALDAEPRSEAAAIEALQELGRINREAMQRADQEAERLGTAGAWSAVFLGIVTLIVGVLAMVATRRHILDPLREIAEVAQSHSAGELHRRCTLAEPATAELVTIATTMNVLLDYRDRFGITPQTKEEGRERQILLALLDARDEPTAIVDEEGALIALNQNAIPLLDGPMGGTLREELRGVPSQEHPSEHVVAISLVSDYAWICTLRVPSSAGHDPASSA